MTDKPNKMTDATMRMRAIFERKIGLSPKELNKIGLRSDGSPSTTIDDLLIEKIRAEMEGKCSQHGWVIPGTLRIISRSMCQNEAGRFTGAMVSWVQVEGEVYYPSDTMLIVGEVLKKNKMGMFVVYKDAIQIMVPRDLHLGNEVYDAVQVGQYVSVEIKKSRFQVDDRYILSVGTFDKVVEKPVDDMPAIAMKVLEAAEPAVATTRATAAAPTTLEESKEESAALEEESKSAEEEEGKEDSEEQLEPDEATRPAAAAATNVAGPLPKGTTVDSFF